MSWQEVALEKAVIIWILWHVSMTIWMFYLMFTHPHYLDFEAVKINEGKTIQAGCGQWLPEVIALICCALYWIGKGLWGVLCLLYSLLFTW